MPEQEVVQSPEWSKESVEKQITGAEKPVEQATDPEKPQAEKPKDTLEVELARMKGAVAEERAKRRGEAARAAELERRLEGMQRAQAEALQPKEVVPDPATDPAGFLVHSQQKTQAEVERMRSDQQKLQQDQVVRGQYERFITSVKAQEAEFVKDQPDALEGINFLKASRVEQYEAAGLSRAEATQKMLRDEWDLVAWAIQNGENPAKAAYEMARKSGYVAATKKLEMQKEGQGASMPSSGGVNNAAPSLNALLEMESEEFNKATEGQNWAKLMKKQMGQ